MYEFLADLHIHSRFSRATSRKLNVPLLAAWAGLKGLTVLGTGDFTHPVWRKELRSCLRYDEASGLYVLADPRTATTVLPELSANLAMDVHGAFLSRERQEDASGLPIPLTRFMLQAEISSIYKRSGKVRKVHSLVFMPNLEAAEALSLRLAELGNLHSDGRPILGLDARDLLEMVLETHPQAFLIPAHIWTPWFSLFGSKSGFDSLEECYGDLSGEIFALETGLSSDPAMNRLWSKLDQYRLVSNSDAHSGANLGREANVFSGTVSYQGMLRALKEPAPDADTIFQGTLEFFSEEGKYHMDGHRKCNVVLTPQETRRLGGLCPVCGGPVTVGVSNRVMELADRESPVYRSDEKTAGLGQNGFMSLVPLSELLGEILGVGSKTRKVADMYGKALERLGPELAILRTVPEDDVTRFSPPLGESIRRMRKGEVHLQGGYDGEYGVVRVFTDKERQDIVRGMGLMTVHGKRHGAAAYGLTLPGTLMPEDAVLKRPEKKDRLKTGKGGEASRSVLPPEEAAEAPDALPPPPVAAALAEETEEETVGSSLNAEQERAIMAGPGPVLVLAGPGTGKTHTLIARILHLLDEGISSRRILAVTFTRRAATEMDSRLSALLEAGAPLPRTDTLHALALELWHKTHLDVPILLSEESARRVFAESNPDASAQRIREAWQAINLARERLEPPQPEHATMGQRYTRQKNAWNLSDYTDLLEFWLEQITGGMFIGPWGHVLVDEIQDLSPLQLTIVRSLVSAHGEGFFGIGDPDQSIYGFRGAYGQTLDFFTSAWPRMEIVRLKRNYRSRAGILQTGAALLGEAGVSGPLVAERRQLATLHLFEAPSAEAEAVWIADRAATLIGLGSHTLEDARSGTGNEPDHSPGDIAVLVRTHALAHVYRKFLAHKGTPVSEPTGDAFWADERVAMLVRMAGRMLGIAVAGDDDTTALACPDKILAAGPLSMAAYLSESPPFDALFWQSSAFRSLIRAYDVNKGWAGLTTWINLQNDLELVRAKGEKIQVMSLHAAKGLEFRTVFIPCFEDGILPFAGPELLTGKLHEKGGGMNMDERRLLYVGLTRAKDNLYLSRASKRILYGHELRLKPSRYLDDLPSTLFTRSTLVAHAARKEEQLRLL